MPAKYSTTLHRGCLTPLGYDLEHFIWRGVQLLHFLMVSLQMMDPRREIRRGWRWMTRCLCYIDVAVHQPLAGPRSGV